MYLSRLRLTNFRNYASLDLTPPPGLVVLVGENAQGKTNLLEAVFFVATSRSPRTARDAEVIAWQAPGDGPRVARVEATVQRADRTVTLDVTVMERPGGSGRPPPAREDDEEAFVAATPGALKRIRINGVPKRAMDLLGHLPVALFRPEDVDLVSGPPANRRRTLDILLAQLDPRYPRALQRYARAVAQRNHLLRRVSERRASADQLAPWDELLAKEGSYLVQQRLAALERLSPLAAAAHTTLSGGRDRLTMGYAVAAGGGTAAATEPGFRAALAAALHRDLALGQTTVGPHRDDVTLLINGAPAAGYGSRGQQRSIALAWRLAEASYLRERAHEPPVVLLDDVLSELDEHRRQAVVSAMEGFEQVFLTTTGVELGPLGRRAAASWRVVAGTLLPS